jgi:phosphatidylglycerophosphatase B
VAERLGIINCCPDMLFDLKNTISQNRFIILSSAIAFALLTVLVFLLPLEFSSYKSSDTMAPIWYFITETGDVIGSIVILTCFTIYVYSHFRSSGRRMRYLAELISLIIVIELSSLALSQLYTKEVIREPRPSQLYFVEKGVIENGGREFFAMPMKEKEKYLQERAESYKVELSDVYPPILSSWSGDTSFSFPSGHSQSSFFLGIMMSFVISRVAHRNRRYLALIPLTWALLVSLSRVIIGVHYSWDVAAGAFIGLVLAFSLISLNITNRALAAHRQ